MAITIGTGFSNPSVLTFRKLNSLISSATIPASEVKGSMIGAGEVTSDKIGEQAVTESKFIDLDDVLNRIYPVGTIYVNASDSTNPATTIGIGTWSLVGVGDCLIDAVPVAVGSAYFPAGVEAGNATHLHAFAGNVEDVAITASQTGLAVHQHADPSISYSLYPTILSDTSSFMQYDQEAEPGGAKTSISGPTNAASTHTHAITPTLTTSTSTEFQTLTVYFWGRSA